MDRYAAVDALEMGWLGTLLACDKIFSAYNEHRRPAEIFAPAKCVPAVSR
jgi:hypothetical protein